MFSVGESPVLRINLFNDMEDKKIALVTGANKGIGFEACRQLAKNGFKVILTSRDEKKGKKALILFIISLMWLMTAA